MAHPDNRNLKISKDGLNLIKKWEGWYPKAYKDPVGIWTIGWGTTGAEAYPGRVITKKTGEAFLKKDLEDDEETVKRLVSVPLNQNQFDALVSFVYNCGSGNFSRSTLRKLINRSNFVGATAQFGRWNRARSRDTNEWMVLKGLTNRRKDEAELFSKPLSDEARDTLTEEVKVQKPLTDPNDHDSTVSAEAPQMNENALMEIVAKSDTVKAAILAITSLGAAVSQMLEPVTKDPVTMVAVTVAVISTSWLIYIKWRDTREFR